MWPRRRPPPDNDADTEPDEVRCAREAAEQAIREQRAVEAMAPAAQAIGAALRDALDRNHFGEQIDAAFRRRRAT